MSAMNRLANCHNRFQGGFKRVLCLCSAGLLRSPTIAWVLANEPYNCNTRSAGVSQEYALIPVDRVLIDWADEIVCANEEHKDAIAGMCLDKRVHCLNIEDNYRFLDPALIGAIKNALTEIGFSGTVA